MVSVGTVASQCLAELDPPSTNFNGGSTCGQIYRGIFIYQMLNDWVIVLKNDCISLIPPLKKGK